MTSTIPADFTLYNFIALKEENKKLKKDCNEAYRKGLYSNNENVVRHINANKTLTCDLQTTKKENEKLKRQMDKLKRANELNSELWDTSQKCIGELEKEIKELKELKEEHEERMKDIANLLLEGGYNNCYDRGEIEYNLKCLIDEKKEVKKENQELKAGNKNVYNEDERGPCIKAKCNFSYVGEFLESRDICPWKTREDEAEEKFQFACEEIASVISSCINRTIKMGNCQELSDYITGEVDDMIDKLIESGHLVENDEDSSDEEEEEEDEEED